jgi:hypothetical protein
MNRTYRTVPTRFEEDVGFDVTPVPPALTRRAQAEALETLRGRLLADLLADAPSASHAAAFERSASEAAALAWLTPYPAFFFPALFEEKARAARRQVERQRQIRARSRLLMEAMA